MKDFDTSLYITCTERDTLPGTSSHVSFHSSHSICCCAQISSPSSHLLMSLLWWLWWGAAPQAWWLLSSLWWALWRWCRPELAGSSDRSYTRCCSLYWTVLYPLLVCFIWHCWGSAAVSARTGYMLQHLTPFNHTNMASVTYDHYCCCSWASPVGMSRRTCRKKSRKHPDCFQLFCLGRWKWELRLDFLLTSYWTAF